MTSYINFYSSLFLDAKKKAAPLVLRNCQTISDSFSGLRAIRI